MTTDRREEPATENEDRLDWIQWALHHDQDPSLIEDELDLFLVIEREAAGEQPAPLTAALSALDPNREATEPLDGRLARQWLTEPDVGRVAHGVPHRVDRLRALGNAVVPQVVQWIGRRIVAFDERGEVAA